eukprot:TRINITY_DN958_c0_g3_i1.p1 TRINITY_DN958_c0_g3~~TRINITY_DN958_c0_g3_i1.p1  ORF type:complete len:273 (+),score=75.36 TRINITY_DN958_c0_g3_i1:57-821(+)
MSKLTESLEQMDINGKKNNSRGRNNKKNNNNNDTNENEQKRENNNNNNNNEEETTTVIHNDNINLEEKHFLQHTWTLWYDHPNYGKKKTSSNWGDSLKQVCTFSTVEDFWRLYNNLFPVHEIPQGSNYHLFKDGIEPKWEDDANKTGGKWLYMVSSKERTKNLENLWLWTVLACIGESFNCPDDEICGCVVSIRNRQDKIALWTKDGSREVTEEIGMRLKGFLELNPKDTIGYLSHAESLRTNRSFKSSNKYQL